MSYQNNQLKKAVRHFIYSFSTIFIFLIISCNNPDSGNTTNETPQTDTNQKKSQTATSSTLFLGSGKASYLAIHIDTLKKLFLPPGTGG
jgi:hypothetical protein